MIPELTHRIDLNTGHSCNLKCNFCYYIKDVKARNSNKDLSTEECKRRISYCYHRKMEVLEITGGEPTIRSDIFELVRFAREVGFSKISIITNGMRLANLEYAKELVNHGVGDFLLSLHGASSHTHDFVTGVKGSFDSLLSAISNLSKLPVNIRCNSVITGLNLYDIYARTKLLKEINIHTVNFILFNPLKQAASCEEGNFLRYFEAAEDLKSVIDDFSGSFKKLTIRYMPLCLMLGYERHIQNVHQVHYDHDEWDYYFRTCIRQPRWKWLGALAIGFMLLPQKEQWLNWGSEHARHAAILQAYSWLHKHRSSQCYRCSYGFICGGIWKEYAKRFGTDELKSVKGELILEPWHFMDEAQRAIDKISN